VPPPANTFSREYIQTVFKVRDSAKSAHKKLVQPSSRSLCLVAHVFNPERGCVSSPVVGASPTLGRKEI
jgi:hypothetical protein